MIINFIFKFCVEAELPVSISQRSYGTRGRENLMNATEAQNHKN